MTATSQVRGWPIAWQKRLLRKGRWVYIDTGEPWTPLRPCAKCGDAPTLEGYDACFGYIKNASAACCGHGIETPYVIYE